MPIVHLVQDDEVDGKARELFEGIKASTGSVPKWMRVMANCDDTLVGFFGLFKSVMDDAPADKVLKWKIAFVVSEINKCDYCVSVTKMQLKGLGVDDITLADIEAIDDEAEKVAIEYARLTAVEAYKLPPELIARMKEYYSDAQIVEITSVVGLFSFINRFNDALGVLPDAE